MYKYPRHHSMYRMVRHPSLDKGSTTRTELAPVLSQVSCHQSLLSGSRFQVSCHQSSLSGSSFGISSSDTNDVQTVVVQYHNHSERQAQQIKSRGMRQGAHPEVALRRRGEEGGDHGASGRFTRGRGIANVIIDHGASGRFTRGMAQDCHQ